MTNWGKPDFEALSPEERQIDAEAEWLRNSLVVQGKLVAWPYNHLVQRGYPPDLVKKYCVDNAEWQKFRLSLKGLNTCDKLELLIIWFEERQKLAQTDSSRDYTDTLLAVEVQVGNYLGALRRGGQLDSVNRLRKAR